MAVYIEGFTVSQSEVNGNSKRSSKKSGGFQSFGLCPNILKGIRARGYKVPTPIQRKCIPLILSGQDVVAMARTGSGKTACFLLPMFEKLRKPTTKLSPGPRALIFSPTRELALQTFKFVKELGKYVNFKSITVLGGDSMDYQFGAIHEDPDIVVATPGRFLHICVEMDLKLTSVEYVVFDEADRLFELGLGDQLQEILFRLPESRQTLLFSATLPKLLIDFAKAGLSSPVLLRLDVESKLPKTLEIAFMAVRPEEKTAALLSLLQTIPNDKLTMVFTATKHHVDYLHAVLDEAGISNTFLYSDLASTARKINVAKFQNRTCSVIIVTDVAARGVDIPQLDYVINYHFPSKSKLFVHRVGRCARAGRLGVAFSFISKSEIPYFLDLIMFLNRPLNIIPINGGGQLNKDGAFGRVPETLIEVEQARLLNWHEKNTDLDSMKKICDNGYKKYLQSNPGASKEALRKAKDTNLVNVGVHPFFETNPASDEADMKTLLSQVKNYKPRGTIFEVKSSMNQRCYEVMKKMRQAHTNFIKKAKTSNNDENSQDDVEGKIIDRKRKVPPGDSTSGKKKKSMDKEFYIPYSAPDQATENGLSINNFVNDANRATFDLVADCEEHLNLQKRIKKWDKEKKKYITVGVSDRYVVCKISKWVPIKKNNDKSRKIKTECGKWIDASYKTGRYEKWKERSKVQNEDEEEDENEEVQENNKFTKKDFPNTHWGRHNKKIAEKMKAKGLLKKPEQIAKARKELEIKRQKSIPKSKRKNWNMNKQTFVRRKK